MTDSIRCSLLYFLTVVTLFGYASSTSTSTPAPTTKTTPEALNAADVTFSNCTNSNIIIHIHRSTSTPVDGYLIWIDLNNKTVYNETISPVSEYTCVKVTNLSVGIRYDLAVKTVLRNISIQRHFYTVPVSPVDVKADFNSTNTIALIWKEPKTANSMSNYSVGIQKVDGDKLSDITNETTIHVEGENATFSELIAGAEYCVSVYKVLYPPDIDGLDELRINVIKICNYTLPDSPVDVKADFNSTNTITLMWKEPKTANFMSNYSVGIQKVDDDKLSDITNETTIHMEGENATFSELTAGAEYCVSVYTVLYPPDIDGLGEFRSNVTKICNYMLPDSPVDVKADFNSTITITLIWKEPKTANSMSNYTVGIQKVDDDKLSDITNETTIHMEGENATFSGVTAGAEYCVSVYTVLYPPDIDGLVELRSSVIKICNYTLPDSPVDVKAHFNSTNTVNLMWKEPKTANSMSNFSVGIEKVDGDESSDITSETKIHMEGENATFSELTAGSEYCVSVYTVLYPPDIDGLVELRSNVIKICNYTLPDYPVDVKADFNSTNTITLMWKEPKTANSMSNYSVGIEKVDDDKLSDITNETRIHMEGENATFSGLTAGAEYCVSVYTVLNPPNIDGFDELRSNVIKICSYMLPDSPVDVEADFNSTNTITLIWKEPKTANSMSNYSVGIQKVDGDESSEITSETTIHMEGENATFSGLTAGSEYCVSVYTVLYPPDINGLDELRSSVNKICNYTLPDSPIDVKADFNSTNTITLIWKEPKTANSMSNYSVGIQKVDGDESSEITSETTIHMEGGNATFSGLTAGSEYCVSVYTVLYPPDIDGLDELRSSVNKICNYTLPDSPIDVKADFNSTNTITLIWKEPKTANSMSNYSVGIQKVDGDESSDITRETTIHMEGENAIFSGLTAGAEYCVTVYTVLYPPDIDGLVELRSSVNKICNYTRPKPPSTISIPTRTQTTMTITLPADSSLLFDSYMITIITNKTGSVKSKTPAPRHQGFNTTIELENLTPGTLYKIGVYSVVEQPSEQKTSISCVQIFGYTVPSQVISGSLIVTPVETSSFDITWTPGNGGYTGFHITPTCRDAYGDVLQNVSAVDTTTNHSTVTRLSPGSQCDYNIVTLAGNQTASIYFNNTRRTFETAPDTVENLRVTNVTDSPRTLNISWARPTSPKGIIRQYVIFIESSSDECYEINVSCQDCNTEAPKQCKSTSLISKTGESYKQCKPVIGNSEKFEQSQRSYNFKFDQFRPFTNYRVEVQAYTRCPGNVSNPVSARTDEAAPAKPRNLTATSVSATAIDLQWDPPEPPNGIILAYSITYSYKEFSCGNSGGSSTTDTVTVEGSFTNKRLFNLHPFWFYGIEIRAKTSKGYGNNSLVYQIQTSESLPGKIQNLNLTPDKYSLPMSWTTPCHPNGIITGYDIHRTNRDDANDHFSYNTSTNATSYSILENILPYRNYSVGVRARTAEGPGNYTYLKDVQTRTAEPYRPRECTAIATGSNRLNISWVAPSLYTGVTQYFVRAIDAVNSSISRNCSTFGFNSTNCIVHDLDEYWAYTLNITAKTTAGTNTTAYSHSFRTLQSTPGMVANISLSPQNDVRLKRSVVVMWEQPVVRDLNGIITKYRIEYGFVGENYTIKEVGNNTFKLNLTDNINPGRLNVKLFASTSVGYGPSRNETTDIMAGAVIKPNETSQQLVQKASGSVSNDERQVAVMLQLKDFLCNDKNGIPKNWGVIVSGDKYATDKPYFGTHDKYKTRLKEYKRWSDIKDTDKVLPYRATDETWHPCHLLDSGNRRRRSADERVATTLRFVVGEDGECKNAQPNGYCNGELKPGTSYRVKTFVCTDGGCTESEYSQPLRTAITRAPDEKAPDVTVPVVAGVLSGIAVVAAVLVVVFVKRREKICFEKHVEEPTFEPEIELKGTTKFRPVTIKLADFPAYVDALHKDSGLLFSDGFRLLKEQSPSHPTTVAEIQSCRPKNRYTNILPFDHSRVKLLPLDDEEGSDFINANFIPGYTSRREYIATQGPLPATKEDFWRMVWEQNVDTIVMLTRCVEKGKPKCDAYWPEVVQEPVYSGDLILNVQSESTLSDYVIRIIEIKLKSQTRTVRQLSFLKWPDMGSPDDSTMLLDFVKTVRQFNKPGSQSPMIVHCSAGVGRTGTFIAVDRLLQHIRDHDDIDVYSTILDMRNYRCNMVQTEDQFVYIYECIKDFITTDEEEDQEEEDSDHLYENTGFHGNIYENTAFQKE